MDKGHTTFATAAAQVHGQCMDLISEGLHAHRQDILTVVTAGARKEVVIAALNAVVSSSACHLTFLFLMQKQ